MLQIMEIKNVVYILYNYIYTRYEVNGGVTNILSLLKWIQGI